jgi:hypothetical protein
MKWFIVTRTIDGRYHIGEAFADQASALAHLCEVAQACRETHRRSEFDGQILELSYAGDDTTLSFPVSEEELNEYPLW